jgi:pimeloyl-ACP methyl ester carboxylesterase
MFHAVGDRRIHSVSFGSGPGTLVGVAGSFASWEIWEPVFELLSPRWRVVGFDHNGVGETKVPIDEITHARNLETLLSVLDAREVDRCVIAGDSNNATLAVEAVIEQPERFAGLVIVNGTVGDFDRPEARRFVEGLRSDFDATLDFFVGLVFPEADSEHLKRWLRDIIARTGPEVTARIVEMYYDVDLRPRLGDVGVPTMIVHGVRDTLAPLEHAKELAEALDAELELIDAAGHLPLLSAPDTVARLLERFLVATTAADS